MFRTADKIFRRRDTLIVGTRPTVGQASQNAGFLVECKDEGKGGIRALSTPWAWHSRNDAFLEKGLPNVAAIPLAWTTRALKVGAFNQPNARQLERISP
jgi:hypothetical protein